MEKILLKLMLIAAFYPASVAAVSLSVELNDLKPMHQDVVLGSRSLLTPTDNDVLRYESDQGFKISLHDSNWVLSYMRLEAIADFAGGARNNEYFVALDHPNQTYGTYSSLSAFGEIELNIIDLSFLFPISTSGPGNLTAFGGFRSANYDMNMNAQYDSSAQVINREAENNLLGFRGGISGRLQFSSLNQLQFAGHMAFALLQGDSKFEHSESTGNLERNLTWPSTVTAIDASVRLEYQLAPMKIWFGYEMLHFENIFTGQHFEDDQSAGTQSQPNGQAGFEGFSLGAEWIF